MKLKSFRRDKLKRMIERGELEGIPRTISGGYFYEGKDWKDAQVFGLTDSDFRSKAGCCYVDEKTGEIRLIVHSNESYAFRKKRK